MTREDLERLDDAGMSAWDAHDAEAFVNLFADDFTWYDWGSPEPIRDKEGAKRFFSNWMTAFPDMRVTSRSRVIGDDAVAAEIEWSGTNTGSMRMGDTEIPPSNRRITGRGTYIARVKDGKIAEFRSHPDAAGMMMQLGMMQAAA